ncbi:hypothetical protein EES39_40375 [Streptomyces sp. ADI92-24]|uniref:hypothetical protein n=1 Tax=Streptomyces sp. ADI92-24 TaxID=1522756 RepID=UPI000F550A0D|nr:hypothetical protein [Streptomyces sp. ADI92-24]RPK29203.1 hypothetical protein EES39_40375 [Streptomyces sp. ADI92-24]
MAVDLVKSDPGDEDAGAADDVELVDDEGVTAEQPSRPRAWWGQIYESLEKHADAPRAPGRAVTRPDLSAYHAFDRAGLLTVRTGSVIVLRWTWTLTRRGWVLAIGRVRKGKGVKSAPKAAAGGGVEGSAKPKRRGGKPPAKKSTGGKKAPAKSGTSTGDLLIGGAVLIGMGAMFLVNTAVPAVGTLAMGVGDWAVDHPVDLIRGAGGFVIIFVVIAWIVGAAAGAYDHRKEDREENANRGVAETEPLEDHEQGQESGEAEPDPSGGEVAEPSPEEVAATERIKVYEWVRGSLKTRGNGAAVHLRELALDSLPEGGNMRSEIGRVRALLTAHQVPFREQVKAPASDKGGASKNRPGVHRDDLPQTFTPLPAQGSNLVRLLPVGQPSDLQ